MTDRQATRIIATLFLVVVALIAWRHVKTEQGAPPPGSFTWATGLFSILAVAADLGAPAFGAIFAAAVTLGVGFKAFGDEPAARQTPSHRVTVKAPPKVRVAVRGQGQQART